MSSDDEEGSDDEQITAGIPNQQVKAAKVKLVIVIQNTENPSQDKIHKEPPPEQVRIYLQPPPTVESLRGLDKGNDNEGDDGVTLPHAIPSVAVQKAGKEAPVTISEEIVTNLGELQMSSDGDEIVAGVPKQQVKKFVIEVDDGATLPGAKSSVAVQKVGKEAPVKITENEDIIETTSGTPPQVPFNVKPIKRFTINPTVKESEADPLKGMTVSQFLEYFFSNPVLVAFFVLCLTIFAIIILSEFFKFIQAVQSAPYPLQVAGYVVVSSLAIALVWAAVRLVMTCRRIVISPQVQLDQARDPYSRAIIREQVAKQVDAGYQAMVALVKEYPIQDPKQIELLRMAGMTEADEVKFKNDIESLKKNDFAGKSKWIDDCDDLFVKKIDDFASHLVSDYSKRVGITTACCPTGLLDALIVIVNSLLLIESLCRLYNVRANWRNSAFLAARLVFNTFISAKLERNLDNIINSFPEDLGLASSFLENTLLKLTSGVGKRVAEGASNYFLINRLGHATMRYLRPIKLK